MINVQTEASPRRDGTVPTPASPVIKTVRLRMYVAGSTLSSLRAVEKLLNVCDRVRSVAIQLEIVDVLEHPEAAEDDDIRVLPVVVWKEPSPKWRLGQSRSEDQHLESWLEMLTAADQGGGVA
jgi:hypothetical protein